MEFNPITRPADDFQQGISADELTAVCRQALGTQMRVISARELGSGLFNSTYLIGFHDGQQVILRVSPNWPTGAYTQSNCFWKQPGLAGMRRFFGRPLSK